jgi:hypothetical protein
MEKGVKEIRMFHDPIGYKKSEPNSADLVYTKEYKGNGIYDIFKNGELVKTIEGEGNANAWINQAKKELNEQATCCGKCGRVHVKGTKCKTPYLKGKDHCRNK